MPLKGPVARHEGFRGTPPGRDVVSIVFAGFGARATGDTTPTNAPLRLLLRRATPTPGRRGAHVPRSAVFRPAVIRFEIRRAAAEKRARLPA